jgi:uncharacterized protein (TIGR02118 family)
MTVKLVVLYTPPADPGEFDRHYAAIHVPLVRAMPGLLRFEAGKFAAAQGKAEPRYYYAAELYFADQAALDAATRSDEGKAAAADFQQIASPGSRMLVQELDD